jgi:hypothetical protein
MKVATAVLLLAPPRTAFFLCDWLRSDSPIPAEVTHDSAYPNFHGAGSSPSAFRFSYLGETVSRVNGRTVTLTSGTALEADFLVLSVGVRPSLALAKQARLAVDRGISVNAYLETSVPGIFAAGDAARRPDPHTGERIRVDTG